MRPVRQPQTPKIEQYRLRCRSAGWTSCSRNLCASGGPFSPTRALRKIWKGLSVSTICWQPVPMTLHTVDWIIAAACIIICFLPAFAFGKRASKNTTEFFASGRSVPWWLAGISIVATTFSATPRTWWRTSCELKASPATGNGGRSRSRVSTVFFLRGCGGGRGF